MKTYKTIKAFTDRYPLVGPIMWILSIQYFLIQVIVAHDFSYGYSLSNNTISDLGNTACGVYGGRFVCSPEHGLMNASFIMLGVFMALGSLFIYQEFKKDVDTLVGFSFMALAGIGTFLVGAFPENTIFFLHILGATLPFFLGNLSIIILGFKLEVPRWLKIYMIATGVISLLALVLFSSHVYFGIGMGGMERITAYPQTLWLIVFGLYMTRNRFLRIAKPHEPAN